MIITCEALDLRLKIDKEIQSRRIDEVGLK